VNATTAHRLARTGLQVTPAGRWTSVAGATYVSAWVAGLLLAPSAPAPDAAASQVHAYYAESASAIVVQASLVHGLAGLALGVLALTVPAATAASTPARRLVTGTGLAAALVSLLQLAFAVVATRDVGHTAAPTSQALFHAINVADTVKLVLLAVFVAAVTSSARRVDMAPRWVQVVALVLAVLLPLGGGAFLVDSAVLTAMLYTSLPLLLVWTGATALVVGLRAH
jgi:hypothetical protein